LLKSLAKTLHKGFARSLAGRPMFSTKPVPPNRDPLMTEPKDPQGRALTLTRDDEALLGMVFGVRWQGFGPADANRPTTPWTLEVTFVPLAEPPPQPGLPKGAWLESFRYTHTDFEPKTSYNLWHSFADVLPRGKFPKPLLFRVWPKQPDPIMNPGTFRMQWEAVIERDDGIPATEIHEHTFECFSPLVVDRLPYTLQLYMLQCRLTHT